MLQKKLSWRITLKQQLPNCRAFCFLAYLASAPLYGAEHDFCPIQKNIFTPAPYVQAGQVDVNAASVVSTDNRLVFTGDVDFRRDNYHLEARRVDYNSQSGDVLASGDVTYSTPKFELHTESISVKTNNKTFESGAATYRVYLADDKRFANQPDYGGGKAAKIILDEQGVMFFEDVDYTTCLAGATGWKLSAGTLNLDSNESEATARNVKVSFKGVPFLYVPWFRFPIGDVRKSGFLVPRFGTSDSRGNEYEFPVYLNIAPQADATLTPRWMTQRGLQLRSEWRYLSNTGRWRLDDEYLDNDDKTNTRRQFTRLRHSGNPFQNWFTSIDASRVSDNAYFDDLGNTLNPTNIGTISYLERRADLTHITNNDVLRSQFEARLQVYQTVDDNIDASTGPYKRVPQLSYDATAIARPAGFAFGLRSELTRFDRIDSITGDRFNLQPRISFPHNTLSGFFRPSLSGWYSRYSLDNVAVGDPESIEFDVPVFSLDTGLLFDRDLEGGSVQTLEPRLFYLRVPFKDQSAIPVFDAHELGFSVDQAFRENRFSGGDRIGDANQVTAGITTRYLDRNGREFGHASLARIFYFEDRRVNISGNNVDTLTRSNLVADMSATMSREWRATAGFEWDSEDDEWVSNNTSVHYNDGDKTRVNIEHRLVTDDYEQAIMSFSVPLGNRWRGTGRWNYGLDEHETLDALLAIDYESCCWAFRTAYRGELIANDGGARRFDRSLFFQLIMKGIGNAGDNIGRRLEDDIVGYPDPYQ